MIDTIIKPIKSKPPEDFSLFPSSRNIKSKKKIMSPETPRDEENLAIDVDSSTNNPTSESATINNSYDYNNEDEADETTTLLKKQGTEIPPISDISGTRTSKKKKLFSLKNFMRLILLLIFIAIIVWLLVVTYLRIFLSFLLLQML